MAELTVDLTYGNALFAAAKELDKVNLVLEESEALLSVLEREPELLEFMNTPAISALEKKAVVEGIFRDRICDELLNFLRVLIDKGRTRHLSKILGVYKSLLRQEEGLSYGEIYSVKPLSPERLQRFETEVGRLLKLNVRLENKLDTGLVGGVKVLVDGKIIDVSVKGRLKELRADLVS